MRNSWLDTYTGGEGPAAVLAQAHIPGRGRMLLNIIIGTLSTLMIGTLVAGSLWTRMQDEQQHQAAANYLNQKFSLSRTVASARAPRLVAPAARQDDEAFALQSISDMTAEDEGSRTDPFAPLVGSGSEDLTKPKDILDGVSFTGFINDAHAKDKVAIISIANPGSDSSSIIKKIGESFNIEDQKVVIRNIKQNTLYLSINGSARELPLVPYIDTVLSKSGGGGGSAGSTASAGAGNGQNGTAPGGSSSPIVKLQEM